MSLVSNDNYFAGVYWGARRESAKSCAERICNYLFELGKIDSRLSRWFMVGQSRRGALRKEIHADVSLIQDILERGRNPRLPPSLQESLGFTLSLWNGASSDDQAVSILFRCGIFAKNVGNSAVLSLPTNCQRLSNFESARRQITALVRHFSPDWGLVSSQTIAQLSSSLGAGTPRAGWLTYLRDRPRQGPISSSFELELLDAAGILVITNRKEFCGTNQSNVASVVEVADWIARNYGGPKA
jgi:hypothetical protein